MEFDAERECERVKPIRVHGNSGVWTQVAPSKQKERDIDIDAIT